MGIYTSNQQRLLRICSLLERYPFLQKVCIDLLSTSLLDPHQNCLSKACRKAGHVLPLPLSGSETSPIESTKVEASEIGPSVLMD